MKEEEEKEEEKEYKVKKKQKEEAEDRVKKKEKEEEEEWASQVASGVSPDLLLHQEPSSQVRMCIDNILALTN